MTHTENIAQYLETTPKSASQLQELTGIPAASLRSTLTQMKAKGLAGHSGDGWTAPTPVATPKLTARKSLKHVVARHANRVLGGAARRGATRRPARPKVDDNPAVAPLLAKAAELRAQAEECNAKADEIEAMAEKVRSLTS